MSDMLARDADGEVPHAFASYPSPPSSGRGAVSLPSGDKRTRYTAEQSDANDDDHHTKRARSQSMRTAILTPPSTRGRRMGDRLGLGDGALAACPPSTSRHQRSDSDTVCCSWLPENARLGMDARPYARLYTAPQFDTYPVHDAAHNPFLEGGPADVGFTGPHAYRARLRATSLPRKELGKSLFVLYVRRLTQPRTTCDAHGPRTDVFCRGRPLALAYQAPPSLSCARCTVCWWYATAERRVGRRRLVGPAVGASARAVCRGARGARAAS